jgi:hypothetical protein
MVLYIKLIDSSSKGMILSITVCPGLLYLYSISAIFDAMSGAKQANAHLFRGSLATLPTVASRHIRISFRCGQNLQGKGGKEGQTGPKPKRRINLMRLALYIFIESP